MQQVSVKQIIGGIMDGQISLFEYIDDEKGYHKCSECEHAKFKETVNGNPFYYCNETRSIITIHTGSWLCAKKGNLFQRREYK